MRNILIAMFIVIGVGILLAKKTISNEFSKRIVVGIIHSENKIQYKEIESLNSSGKIIVPFVQADTNNDNKPDISIQLNLMLPSDQGVLLRKYYYPTKAFTVECWLYKETNRAELRFARIDLD
jgi:hypothetical protein